MPNEVRYLLFRLQGVMASWGDITVGEIRSTWDRPSKSAVLGLVAAALGIDRDDDDGHRRLHSELFTAVRVDGAGPATALRDFHTAQSPSTRKGVRFATRRDELHETDPNTIISERWYWSDHAATIAVWLESGPGQLLEEVAEALQAPHYVLYLGRKSCPLSAPPEPHIILAADVGKAFLSYDALIQPLHTTPAQQTACQPGTHIYTEVWADDDIISRHQRRDGLISRSRLIFSDRAEVRIAMPPSSPSGGAHVSE